MAMLGVYRAICEEREPYAYHMHIITCIDWEQAVTIMENLYPSAAYFDAEKISDIEI